MTAHHITQATEEIRHLKKECTDLLAQVGSFHPVAPGTAYPKFYKLLAVPLLYSAWERCFTLCHAIGLRTLRDHARMPRVLGPTQRAVWLIQAPFYHSLIQKWQNQLSSAERDRIKRGHFQGLSEFVAAFDDWSGARFDPGDACGAFVMTFSNVNPDVVDLNAAAIGIADFPEFKKIKYGRLHDLVGLRNDIGHGAYIEPPPDEHFRDLLQFTTTLVEDYCNAFEQWIRIRFQPAPKTTSIGKFQRLATILAEPRSKPKPVRGPRRR